MNQQRDFITYLNGKLMPNSRAVELLQKPEMQSAGGYYDTERTFGGRIFKLHQHLERLYSGLRFSQIDPGVALHQMERLTQELLEANRPMLSPGEEVTITQVVSLGMPSGMGKRPHVNVVISCQPLDLAAFAMSYVRGVRLVTPATYGVPEEVSERGVKEGRPQVFPLMTNREGSITECKGANFMFVQDGRIKLPDRSGVLAGISMQTALELAASLNIPVDEGDYCTYDVYMADEAFVSSTRYCMLPVVSINGYLLGRQMPGPFTCKLMDAWRELVGVDFVQRALDRVKSA